MFIFFLLGSRTNGNNRSYVEFVKFARIVTQHSINHGGSETDTENGLRRSGIYLKAVAGEGRC